MQPFRYTLSNNGTVAGIHCIPPPTSTSSVKHRPLIVGLHGGCYDSQYFDATPDCSASATSTALGVPFVAIDRPSYGGTSSILPIPEGSDFAQETGIWLHRYILPKLWSEIGVPNGCNCIVLLCHSLGVMGGVVAAALHAQNDIASYPLGGLIASGMGDKQSVFTKGDPPSFIPVDANHALFPLDDKDNIMFKPGTVSPEVLEQSERLNAVCPLPETANFVPEWLSIWKEKWAAFVSVPVMFSLVGDDPFFISTEEEVETCVRAFKNSSRVDGSLIKDAPHCVELSRWSLGWYARCFGFAMECSASYVTSS
ncbi:Putative alpha/beta hydrolase-1 [Colletotrichum destructivum]|uniref:Alpha/beta hydrolase-1 n=1 Tax=Colletotrichum destructivum TaxID=34406 RepID=A0AAX4IQZ8_9PEZI|nr:Putative alpha/beta hydrolase-1 [Colletotrichum destructivum]